MSRFVHLRVRTEYAIVDSIVRIKPLMQKLSQLEMNAVGISDFCNFFAAVKVYQAAISQGLKPLLGVDLPCCFQEKPNETSLVSLICQDQLGYKHATQLVSKAYLSGQVQGSPHVFYEWIPDHAQGLIALSGASHGLIGQCLSKGDREGALEAAKKLSALFPDRFYLEIQRIGRPNEAAVNAELVSIANQLNLPLVATNEVRFLQASEHSAHEARICIHEGRTISESKSAQRYTDQQHLRSVTEMETLFADLPQALENTVEISKRCTVKMNLGKAYLPKFDAPNQLPEGDYLVTLSKKGLETRLQQLFGEKTELYREKYDARLALELEVIQAMGFPGYFLIVADFIGWAKANDIPVGPGRGSGAGSLVAYALKITDLDPLAYELLFERFLNPERVSMPDFDVDFCMEGRDRVIEYVAEKYGRQSVSQIITFGSMAAKAVVRDVGRVLGHPYGFVDKLAKLIPFELGITLQKALQDNPDLKQRYENEEEVTELLNLALHLEGLTRNPGKHAGGVVIAPSALTDFTAVYCEAGSNQLVSQFDKDDVEAAGLVKFDFLGLRTLTIIDWALKAINQLNQQTQAPLVDIERIPLNCKKTFDLLKACQTTAVFQLESRGMKELIHRLQPDSFEEIIALVALFRPGPLQSGMVDDFINRKHGRAKVEYPHPDLEPILKPTYGVILYQEQVMQIAQVLANYTLGAADLLRRAMGKKKPEEMAEQRTIFVTGAQQRGIDDAVSGHIFDLMEKFAGYGFNKSHSAAYALISYQTAWLKAHFPAAFMAAVLSSDMDNTDKVVGFIEECRQMKLTIFPPSVEKSDYQFTVAGPKEIRYGLGAIKGVGEAAISLIKATRPESGFNGLFQFCERVDLRKVNKRVLEALIKSGAMDEWGMDRGELMSRLEEAMHAAEQHHQNQHQGQLDLFGVVNEDHIKPHAKPIKTWSLRERLNFEKETLGLYLSGHPASAYHQEFGKRCQLISELNPARAKKGSICAMVTSIRTVVTKRGKTLVIVGLEDQSARFEVLFLAEAYQRAQPLLVVGDVLVVEGEISIDDYTGKAKMVASMCYSIEQARSLFATCLRLNLTHGSEKELSTIQAILKSAPGQNEVEFNYQNTQAQARLRLGESWRVKVSDELLFKLKLVLGENEVDMCYE